MRLVFSARLRPNEGLKSCFRLVAFLQLAQPPVGMLKRRADRLQPLALPNLLLPVDL
jgi:hypothetical protein